MNTERCIVERLIRWSYSLANEEADMVNDAMTEIERLRALIVELVAALEALVEHADNMEAQNSDYHEMGAQGMPCRSAPLNDAFAAIAKAKI